MLRGWHQQRPVLCRMDSGGSIVEPVADGDGPSESCDRLVNRNFIYFQSFLETKCMTIKWICFPYTVMIVSAMSSRLFYGPSVKEVAYALCALGQSFAVAAKYRAMTSHYLRECLHLRVSISNTLDTFQGNLHGIYWDFSRHTFAVIGRITNKNAAEAEKPVRRWNKSECHTNSHRLGSNCFASTLPKHPREGMSPKFPSNSK